MLKIVTKGRKDAALTNTAVGFVSMFIPIFLNFLSRKFFLESLNVEYLGINGTFTSFLGTLALTELGFQTAVVYCLYKPLKDNNEGLVNSLMNVLRVIYVFLGVLFIVFPFLFLPFLSSLLKGTVVDTEIKICFILSSFSSAFSYFLAYKRCLLFADQREYISKLVDLLCNVIFITCQIISLLYLRSFVVWCLISCLRVVTSNIIIQMLCKKLYPYLHREAFSKEVFGEVWSYTKNIIILRFAALAYECSGNMIISAMLGAAYVGFLGNYLSLIKPLKNIANGMLVPVLPIIGNLILDKDNKKNETILRVYTFIRLLLATLIVVPFLIVADDLITIWIGDNYVMEKEIKFLLAAEAFICVYYTACCDFIGASGLFDKDRNVALIGALINILTSIALLPLLGVAGVLWGSVISQTTFWIMRSIITFKYCLDRNKKGFIRYWVRSIWNITILLVVVVISFFIYNYINVENVLMRIIFGCTISFFISLVIYIVVYSKTMELSYLLKSIKEYKNK